MKDDKVKLEENLNEQTSNYPSFYTEENQRKNSFIFNTENGNEIKENFDLDKINQKDLKQKTLKSNENPLEGKNSFDLTKENFNNFEAINIQPTNKNNVNNKEPLKPNIELQTPPQSMRENLINTNGTVKIDINNLNTNNGAKINDTNNRFFPSEEQLKLKVETAENYFIGYHFPICIIMVIYIILFFIGQGKLKTSELNYFARMGKNWALGPIISVSEKCMNSKDNKNEMSLIQDFWDGTLTGCKCSYLVYRGSCRKTQRRNGCFTISSRDPIKLTIWKGVPICLKRMNENYLELHIENDPMRCNNNKRSCGIIDSQNNYLCLENSIPCPINRIQLYSQSHYSSNSTTSEVVMKFDRKYSRNNTSNILVFSNSFTNNVIPIDFKTSVGLPCKNPYYENIPKVYILSNFYNRNTCYEYINQKENIKFDSDYNYIDRISKKDFFDENGVSEVIRLLPSYDMDDISIDLNLYSKGYVGLSLKCLKDIKLRNVQERIIEELNNLVKIQENSLNMTANYTFTMIFAIMELIILFFGVGGQTNRKKILKYRDITMFELIIYVISILIVFLINLFNLVYNGQIADYSRSEKYLNEFFSDSTCVDKFTFDLYQISISSLAEVKNYFVILNILILVILIIHLVFLFFAYRFIKNYRY